MCGELSLCLITTCQTHKHRHSSFSGSLRHLFSSSLASWVKKMNEARKSDGATNLPFIKIPTHTTHRWRLLQKTSAPTFKRPVCVCVCVCAFMHAGYHDETGVAESLDMGYNLSLLHLHAPPCLVSSLKLYIYACASPPSCRFIRKGAQAWAQLCIHALVVSLSLVKMLV